MPLTEGALDRIRETDVVALLQLAHVPRLLPVPRGDRRFDLLGRAVSLLDRRRLLGVVVVLSGLLRPFGRLLQLLGCPNVQRALRGSWRFWGAFCRVVCRQGFDVAHLLPSSQDLLRLGPYQRAPLLPPR